MTQTVNVIFMLVHRGILPRGALLSNLRSMTCSTVRSFLLLLKIQTLWHDGPNTNVIKKSEGGVLIQRVDQIKILMSRIHERLIGYEVFEELHDDCKIGGLAPKNMRK